MHPAGKNKAATGKKKNTLNSEGGDPEAPNLAQWNRMHSYLEFDVQDKDEIITTFRVGDFASILPEHTPPEIRLVGHEWWLGQILDIRSSDLEEHPWIKVQWMYSGDDIKGIWPKFDPYFCQLYERASSTHQDYVSPSCFSDLVIVKQYDESSIAQELISDQDFFCRHHLNEKKLLLTLRRNDLPTAIKYDSNTCICTRPYDPLDTSSYMHFCPRPSCRKAYHESCLVSSNSYLPETSSYRKLLLLSSPHDDDKEYDPIPRPTKRRKTQDTASTSGKIVARDVDFDAAIKKLDDELVDIAVSPAVKGRKLNLGYINGNIEQVCKAREMVYEMLQDQREKDDWRGELDMGLARKGKAAMEKVKKARKKGLGKKKYMFCCPGCGSAI